MKKYIQIVPILAFLLFFHLIEVVEADDIHIEVWYSNTQRFGDNGLPQRWINILGEVTSANEIDTFTYSLNNGPLQELNIGPDSIRLVDAGDFNIDIDINELNDGKNTIEIIATDVKGNQATETIDINFNKNGSLPLPYDINWEGVNNIQDVAQVVDGMWLLEQDGIRTARTGYDRVVAVGDTSWESYEVVVPITLNKNAPKFDDANNGSAVDLVVRWNGHDYWGDYRPAIGWWPLGGAGMHEWPSPDESVVKLAGNKIKPLQESFEFIISEGETYFFKMRVETMPDLRSIYSFKTWPENQAEPEEWQFFGVQREWHPLYGSVLLVAHNTDITVGDIKITPILNDSQQGLFGKTSSFFSQLPIIVVCLAGLFFAWRYRKVEPKVSRFTAVSLIIIIIHSTVGTYLGQQLPYLLQKNQIGTHKIGYSLGIVYFLQSAVVALALLLLVTAVFKAGDKNMTSQRNQIESNKSKSNIKQPIQN